MSYLQDYHIKAKLPTRNSKNLCAGLSSHLLVFWAGWSPAFWHCPARPAVTQPVQRVLAHTSLAKMFQCSSQPTPYPWGKLRSHGHKTRHMAFPKKRCVWLPQTDGGERPRCIACCLPFRFLAVCEPTCLQSPAQTDRHTLSSMFLRVSILAHGPL